MIESIARLLFTLVQPGSQLVMLLTAVIFLFYAGYHRKAVRVLGILIVLWLVYATPFLPDHLVSRLENTYPVLTSGKLATMDLKPDATYIVVLGAGHTPDPRLEPTHTLTNKVMMRLVEAVRLYRLLPGSRIVTSASAVYGDISQAEALKQAAIAMGVDEADIYLQDDPTNTCEEARAFVRDHGTGTSVIIATSALHQRRAMMLFEKQGARPVAAPAAFAVKKNPDRPFQLKDAAPSLGNVDKLERAIWEYSGFIWGGYRCRKPENE